MSNEIKNFREAIERFDEILIDLGVVSQNMNERFSDYRNVIDASIILHDILESLQALQNNAKKSNKDAVQQTEKLQTALGKNYRDEYSQTKKDFNELFNNINKAINNLQNDINTKIHHAADNVDLSEINKITVKLQLAINQLNDKASQINEATNKFNTINRSVSLSLAIMLIFIGLVGGFSVATFFKITALSDYYFSEYDKKLADLKKENKVCKELK